MENTAIKDMVDYIQELKDKTTDESENYMLIAIWVHALYLIEKERVQLEEAFKAGNKLKQAGIFAKKVEIQKGSDDYYKQRYTKSK
jgi:hypothetical protein